MDPEVLQAIEYLQEGKVILYPTDTIWGLGCDPSNQEAVDRIFEIKNRPKTKPLILLVDGIKMLKSIVKDIHPHLENVLEYNVRPLTIIYEKPCSVFADGIKAGNGSVAIRIVQNNFCKEMIVGFGFPIVSTSANLSEQPFPKTLAQVHSNIVSSVDHLVCPTGYRDNATEAEPSLIARFDAPSKELIFLRS